MELRQQIGLCILACAALPSFGIAADMPGMPGMAMHAGGGGEMLTRTAGEYRIELHVLQPEEFYSSTEVAAKHISAGMLIVGGPPPLAVNATPAPNHHLIVHVFDRLSGAPVTDAKVQMSYRTTDTTGKASGAPTEVPVVTMQAIGAGASSTHYGNNVVIAAGSYSVAVTVNGKTAHFPLKI